MEQIQPDKVYTSQGADVPFTELLDNMMSEIHPQSNYAVGGSLVEFNLRTEFVPTKGRQLLQAVHIVEGGAYTHQWSTRTSEMVDAEDVHSLADDHAGEPVLKKPRGGYRQIDRAVLEADQNRRNAAMRLEAFLTSIDSSQITVSRSLHCRVVW